MPPEPQPVLGHRVGHDARRADTTRADRAHRAHRDRDRTHPDQPRLDRLDRQRRASPAIASSAARERDAPTSRDRHTRPRPASTTPACAASTTYRYRVRAVDAAGNLSPYSSIAHGDHAGRSRHDRPDGALGLTATAAAAARSNLTWTASTDNVGVAGYRVERCQGAGCTNFTQVAPRPHDATPTPAWRPRPPTATGSARSTRAGNLSATPHVADATTTAAPATPPGLVGGVGVRRGIGHHDRRRVRQRQRRHHHRRRTWSTQGRYGNGLSFNGTNSVVRVAELGVAEPDARR